jgi:amino-transferase class IV
VMAAAAGAPSQRLRLVAVPEAAADATEATHGRDARELRIEIDAEPIAAEPAPDAAVLAPVVLPGGLGAHKWRDRRLLDELAERVDAVPLIVDLDGDVLEAAYANVFIVEGTHLVTAPLDGRQLPGTVRARVLALHPAREERLTLDRIAAADELVLASSIRGIHPARLVDGEEPRFHLGARLRAALREDSLGVAAR